MSGDTPDEDTQWKPSEPSAIHRRRPIVEWLLNLTVATLIAASAAVMWLTEVGGYV